MWANRSRMLIVDILNTLKQTTIGSGLFSSGLFILDLMLILSTSFFLSFVEQQHLHKRPLKGGTHLNNWNVSRALTSGLGGITDCSQWNEMTIGRKIILCIEILSSTIQQATHHLVGDKSITAELKVSIFNFIYLSNIFDKVPSPSQPLQTNVSHMKNYFILVQIKTFYLTSNIIIKIIKSPITPVISNKL